MVINEKYHELCRTFSDIYEHLPTLKEYASKCNTIVECGVRAIVSSYAFACGLSGNPQNKLYMVDPVSSNEMPNFLSMCKTEGINAEFFNQSDLDCPLVKTDLLFIDTWHVYGQLKRELERWNQHVSKYIIMHDTTVDEWDGETLRCGLNEKEQSIQYGIPTNEILKGLWPAIQEFLDTHPEWVIAERYTNNNGLTILKRI
jgi:hypothetical protein